MEPKVQRTVWCYLCCFFCSHVTLKVCIRQIKETSQSIFGLIQYFKTIEGSRYKFLWTIFFFYQNTTTNWTIWFNSWLSHWLVWNKSKNIWKLETECIEQVSTLRAVISWVVRDNGLKLLDIALSCVTYKNFLYWRWYLWPSLGQVQQ